MSTFTDSIKEEIDQALNQLAVLYALLELAQTNDRILGPDRAELPN